MLEKFFRASYCLAVCDAENRVQLGPSLPEADQQQRKVSQSVTSSKLVARSALHWYTSTYVLSRDLMWECSLLCLFCSIADVSTHGVGVGVSLRSSAGGVGVAVSVGSIDMAGRASTAGGKAPQIVSTDLKVAGMYCT